MSVEKLPTKYAATIQALSHEGRGVAKVNGKTVFIENALPGEEVTFKYLKKHSKYGEGISEHVANPSADRVEPFCPHFSICGGCSLQHMSQDAQLTLKQNVLLEQLTHFAQLVPEALLPPLMGPIYGYRRKARLGVRFVIKKNQILVGFHEKNGRYIADISSCPILDGAVSQLISPLKECLMQLTSYREIPQIELACGDEEKALVFRHLQPLSIIDQQLLIEFGKKYQAHIYLQPAGPKTTHRIWPTVGDEQLTYCFPRHQIELKFHPQDFIQVNAKINQQMVDRVLELLAVRAEDCILDLFCGLGNFTLPIAKYCQKMVGVEGDEVMVDRAQENAKHNQLPHTAFFKHDLTVSFQSAPFAKQAYNKVLLDPPRSGAREILADIAGLKPSLVVYISCNPATLARDAGELVHQHGFRLKSAGIMDMFPQTKHVESIAVFEAR